MGIRQFGCVRFDSDDPNYGGWAAVAGGKAFRISSVGNLDNATLWWTNLSFAAMHESNLHKTHYIKRTTYLNSWLQGGMHDICLGWGFLRRSHTEKEITENLSAIFDRVMRYAQRQYDLDFSKSVPIHDNLADELRCTMLPDKDPHISKEVDFALGAAHQYYTYCVTPRLPQDGFSTVLFSVPAVRYAHEMIDAIIPTDQVEFIHAEQLPPKGQRLDWIMAQPRPVLARVTVSNINPDFVNVIAFANGAKTGSNRGWVSQPELLLLSQYAAVDIDSLFLFGEYDRLPESCNLPSFTHMQAMTPTAEIISSNHWIGLSRENPFRLEPGKQRAISPRAAWITAIDRFMMFTYALQLHRAGIAVKRYGAGNVQAVVPDGNYRDAYEIATSVGLIAPTTLVNDILVQEELQTYAD
ncbi:MAG: hypothetical protein KAX55_00225 [Propionivibrio sp.]|nr:hypothetical protein [Propionivibrio sp.]